VVVVAVAAAAVVAGELGALVEVVAAGVEPVAAWAALARTDASLHHLWEYRAEAEEAGSEEGVPGWARVPHSAEAYCNTLRLLRIRLPVSGGFRRYFGSGLSFSRFFRVVCAPETRTPAQLLS